MRQDTAPQNLFIHPDTNEWVTKQDKDMDRYLNTPKWLTWPDLPTPPDYSVPFELGKPRDGEPYMRTGVRSRCIAMKLRHITFAG
ncbi:uncharacterized protein N7500_002490 [Penicillium coprophilum]|uniref:uncharacterized protein n=1 Tax=Penicillium coprophilum TaxID=36646 RepID=UPI00239BC014|nr:uncharacterized protein N7500_002490 [Penicillium coprophilum]KAJ5169707.1 hypothetical protein N7500_002490 [Penicillium coprophilum]